MGSRTAPADFASHAVFGRTSTHNCEISRDFRSSDLKSNQIKSFSERSQNAPKCEAGARGGSPAFASGEISGLGSCIKHVLSVNVPVDVCNTCG